jgi:hypothetical protein
MNQKKVNCFKVKNDIIGEEFLQYLILKDLTPLSLSEKRSYKSYQREHIQ